MLERRSISWGLAVVMFRTLVAVLVGGVMPACRAPERWQRVEYSQVVMGVRARVVMYSDRQRRAEQNGRPPHTAPPEAAARAAFDAMNRLDAVLSDYRPDSEISRLASRAGHDPAPISTDLTLILKESLALAERSAGAFDVTCGPVVQLWRAARKSGQRPTAEAISLAKLLTGSDKIKLSTSNDGSPLAQLATPGMQLDFGGIGKGYAADRALEALTARGYPRSLVSLAGDFAVGEAPPDAAGWRLAIPTSGPSATPESITVARCGVSTSGDTEQFVVIDGVRYSHIVDPQTGLGLTQPTTVTVVAPNATLSDALGTALCVLGPQAGRRLLEHYPGAAARFVSVRGTSVAVDQTPGFPTVHIGDRAEERPERQTPVHAGGR